MVSSAHDSQVPGAPDPEGSAAGGMAPRGPADPATWRQVLEKTLTAPNPAERLSDRDREALLEVARRHPDQPFALEPVGVELVQAMLGAYFDVRGDSPEPWRSMARPIAQSLCSDPELERRLVALWARLGEAAR